MLLILNIVFFVVLLLGLWKFSKDSWSLSRKVFLGLAVGLVYGLILQLIYGAENPILQESIQWFDVVGKGYVKLLQMIIMPLVFISILTAVTRLHSASSLGKISFLTIGYLLFTTMVAALVAVGVAHFFGLTAEGLIHGTREAARLDAIETHYVGQVAQINVPDWLLSFLPQNPFADLTGAKPTAIISVVIFSIFLGFAALEVLKSDKTKGLSLISGIETINLWIMKLVRVVMTLTPYGVMALMVKVVASSNIQDIKQLGSFIVASYVAIILMFIIHAVLLGIFGINPLKFFKKVLPVLTFAFSSRSSSATIPLSIDVQTRRLGVPESIASFAASFGTTIGQNGCAGIYPAMLAVMVAPTMGINPMDPLWIATLVGVVTLSSIGVAGVGGGATFAALIVLPAMNLPIELVALLISIEPLIDMGRTALNVNGSLSAGTVTAKLLNQLDVKVEKSEAIVQQG